MTETLKRELNQFLTLAGGAPLTLSEQNYVDTFLYKEGMSECEVLKASVEVALKRFQKGLCESFNEDIFKKLAQNIGECSLNSIPLSLSTLKDRFTFGVTPKRPPLF
jgi:hypothetical protein